MAAAAALQKLRGEVDAAKQLAESAAAALTFGVDRAADKKHAATVVNRLLRLQEVRKATVLNAATGHWPC